MTDSTAPLFSARDRRVLLWLCVAAVCWRWLLAIRAPLPGLDACQDLWVAQQLAKGDFGALAAVWWRPWWALAVAPAVACGAKAFATAQVLGCVVGGLVLWPVAAAAQRLRPGAGVPAAVVVLAAAVPSQGAAVGSALPVAALLVALAVLAQVRGRWLAALGLAGLAAAAGGEQLVPIGSSAGSWTAAWLALRGAWSLAAPFALLALLPPRPRHVLMLWTVTVLVPVIAWSLGWLRESLPAWSPILAVLCGVGLARWPQRLGELALAGIVVVDFLAAWQAAEPRDTIVERLLGSHLAQRLGPGQQVVADLPRLLFYAGQRPAAVADGDGLLQAASRPGVAFVVLGRAARPSGTATAALSGRFVRYQVPTELRDLVVDRHLTVFVGRE